MSADQSTADLSLGGRGRLAQVIATRGGRAAPEAPFVIEHREALIYMLCQAAELEHTIMCQYLFAAFSLKQSTDEGLTGSQLAAVQRWRRQVSHVATQEMLHLALVHNLLSAVGAAPHMARPNLPAPAGHYPAGVQLALLPFGEQALRHFMFLERPEGMALDDAEGLAAVARATPVVNEQDIVPQGQDFATVGHLYRSIEAGFDRLAGLHGEDWLFVGPPRAQATAENFGWPELVAVTDLAGAHRAIDEILEQGEGPRGDWRAAHFGQFVDILDEYEQLTQADPDFRPVRPVMAANVRRPERVADLPLIDDPLTARVVDLFNVVYEILLQLFERFFAHTEETDAQLKVLADATVALMLRVLKPVGDLVSTLPVGETYPGRTAGPSFELFYESDYVMPHREAAWALLAERLGEAAWLCEAIQTGRGREITDPLEPALGAMRELSRTLAAHLPAGSAHAGLSRTPPTLDPGELAALARRAEQMSPPPGHQATALFRDVRAIVRDAAVGRGCGAADQALVVPRLVESVLRPLAGARREPSAPRGAAPTAGTPVPRPGAEEAVVADRVWQAATTATRLRAAAGRAGADPRGLAEATAALQDLALRLAPAAEAAARLDQLWTLQADLPRGIRAEHDGPHLVTNVPRLIDHLGRETRPAPSLALCRCGESAIKPLCDGSHARSGFTDDKDPHRVPDRRDTYPGQQITVLDNRGTCQHSGLCSDRLATVFRTGTEPFVAPSGGRMDEIIRAVRDCPSGALSLALDGVEARALVDRAGTRPPAIEVTRDGPYRITGGIPLLDAAGRPTARNQGASTEHYALCRCGHSQNKPFCSGMHWYVQFRDPVPAAGSEPTLFEWAGGLPGLTRTTRLFYEKHVPADPVLAPLFAQMAPDQPQRLAGWLAEALGGPAAPAHGGDLRGATVGRLAGEFGEAERARWVALLGTAADEALLPVDGAFRSALSACLEWASRAAASGAPAATPRWDWGPGGPPVPQASAAAADAAPSAPLPGPDQPVGFAEHIRPLFRDRDRQSMSFAFDLWAYDDVRARADDVLRRLRDGSMPCDGAWPAERVEVFQRWRDTGMRP